MVGLYSQRHREAYGRKNDSARGKKTIGGRRVAKKNGRFYDKIVKNRAPQRSKILIRGEDITNKRMDSIQSDFPGGVVGLYVRRRSMK